MKDKFNDIKQALIKSGLLKSKGVKGAGVALPPIDVEPNPGLMSFANHCVRIDRDTVINSPEKKYYHLLYQGMKIYVEGMSKLLAEGKTSGKEYENLKEFKQYLDTYFKDKDDVLFMFRFVMADKILKVSDRNNLWEQVVNGKMKADHARKELQNLAYRMFLKTSKSNVKRECLKIAASNLKCTDLQRITEACKFDENDESPYYPAIYYSARGVDDKKYKSYREVLKELKSDDIRSNVPEMMNKVFDGMVIEADLLFRDDTESEKTKDHCHDLMKQVVAYRKSLADIESKKEALTSIPAEIRSGYEDEIKRDIKNLQKQAEKIDDKMNQLSSDTSSKRWGRIILCVSACLILGVMTAGVGLGVGLGMIVNSIRSESEFFKVKGKHHGVVSQARTLLKETESARVELTLPELGKDEEGIELTEFTKADPLMRQGRQAR